MFRIPKIFKKIGTLLFVFFFGEWWFCQTAECAGLLGSSSGPSRSESESLPEIFQMDSVNRHPPAIPRTEQAMDNPIPVDLELRLGSLGQAAQVLVESQTSFFGVLPDTIRDHICSNINERMRLEKGKDWQTPFDTQHQLVNLKKEAKSEMSRLDPHPFGETFWRTRS